MSAMDALNRARLAWEATQPQLTLPGVLEQATAGNTSRHLAARGAGRLLERTKAPIGALLSPTDGGPVRSTPTSRGTAQSSGKGKRAVPHKGA